MLPRTTCAPAAASARAEPVRPGEAGDLMARVEELPDDGRADETRGARDEDSHLD